MTFEEAKIKLKRKQFWLWSKILAVAVITVNFIVYLFLHFRQGHWHSFSAQDLSEIEIIELSYNLPWWTNIIFSFIWLAFSLGVYWYFYLEKLKLNQKKLDIVHFEIKQREKLDKELNFDLFVCEAYQFSLNYGAIILSLIAAIYFGGALYGLLANIIFDLYFHILMVVAILVWSFVSPFYEFILRRIFKRKKSC